MKIQRGKEYPIPNEDIYIEKIISLFKRTLIDYYPGGVAKRVFHPKMHGLIRAEFHITPDLPKDCQVGIFKADTTYPAWIRLSNAKKQPAPDKKKDMRGMAIKLFGVEEPKLLKDKKDAITHDFVLVSTETLQTRSVKDFFKSLKALFGSRLQLFLYAITHIPVVMRSIRQISKCSNLLETSFFSTTPYKFGSPDQAVKYAVIPQRGPLTSFPENPDNDYLREQLVKDLSEKDHYFDFMIQFQEDPEKMPIEDPTVMWTSPYVKVATIRIPKQEFNSAEQRKYGEELSFTPWHCIEAHRPLGGVNRARKKVYETIAALRRDTYKAAIEEPEFLPEFVSETYALVEDNEK